MDHHNTTRLGFGARTRKALAILVSALMAMPSPAVLANPPVPSGHTKTGAYVSANGVPVVNIAAPNAKGISHNKYTRYDVGPNGLVLNNATDPTQSKLAGMLLGNPNLNGRSASIILNEVVAPNRSLLQGFQEVNGPAAELILANPYGITCSGCGFINTPRATLTTGIPEIDGSGALRGFSVRQGDVLITGDGLNAGEVNYFDIVARSIRVEGQINAQTLNLVAGTNSFDYDTRAVSAIAPDGDAPAYAIDSSALGGMYVDRIRLIATEQGVGVRMLGDVAATVDDIEITAAGKIELANRMSAERDVNVRYTGGVQTTSVEIGGAGEAQIYAAGNASIDAGDGGFALAQADVGAGGDLHLRGATLADTGSSTDYRFADGEMTVEVAGQAVFGGATYDSMGGLSVSASSADLGSATLVSRDATAALTVTTAGRLDVHDAMVYSAGNIALTSGGDVDLGTNAEVIAGGSVSLDFAGDSVNRGLIYAEEDVRVRNTGAGAASFVNSGASAYVQAGGTLQIGRNGGAATFSFQQDAGAVAAGSQTVINAHRLDNAGTLQTEELAVADGAAIDNSGDVYILGHAATDLNLGSFANSGVWYAEGDQTVTADTFTNTGVLQAGSASIHANTIETGDAGSLLYTENDLSLRANNVTRLGAGKLYAGGDLTIVTPTLDDHGADGLRMAAGDLTLSVLGNDIELQDGQVYDVGGRLAVETTALRLATGAGARHTYFSSGAETLIYAGEVELGSSAAVGAVVSDGDIRIDAHTIELAGGTNGGSIQAQGSIAATFSKLDVSGAMLANGDISLRGKDGAGNATVDVAGDLMSGGTLSIRGADLLPRAIKIEVADGGRLVGEALDIYADSLGISGTSATAYGLVQGGTGGGTVDVNTMVNAPYAKFIGNVWGDTAPSKTTLKIGSMLFNLGLLYAQGDLEVGGEEAVLVNTETAAISSGYGDLALVARRIENYGTLYAGRDLFATVGTDFYNGTYNNFAGTIATGRHATITVTGANGVFSNEGTIDIGGNGEINAYRFRNNLTHRIETVVQNQRDKQYHSNADSGRYVDYDRQRISAKDVDITAAYHTSNTTSSSEGIRIGVAAEASPEGAFTGFKIEGGSSDSTGSARIAGTSSLKSDGDITIIAGNKLTNEGTRYDAAKDINIAAAEVENRAARNQTSSMQSADNYEVGLMSGVTTGGIGQSIADIATGQGSQINIASPESQVRITVNAGTSSATENRDDAVVTEMKAGGNINYQVSGKLTDEGTKYTAGQDIRLDVGSYEAKAAYNHLETSSSSTSGGGMLTVGVNAATEVTAAASAHGSNQDDWQRSSTAVVGSMNAGGNVIVRTREDAVFEGTKIDAGKDVVVDAGGNLQFKQANDFLTTRSASQEGSANVSASACADLTCASANVGASARTTEMEETSRTGVAGSINAGGNVVLKSGDDMLFQGTNITSKGDTSLIAGGNIDFQALSSSVTRTSSSDGGGADLGASVGKSMNMLKDGALNVGVSFEQGREEYQADNRQGGGVTAGGKFTIQSGGDTRLEGTQVVASTAEIDVKGNFTMESAQSTEKRDSHLVKGRTEIDLGIDQDGNDGKGSKSFGGSVDLDVGVDNKDNLTNQNAFIRTTGGTTLNVGGDATLAGANIDAGGGVSGEIKGNLVVETRTDRKLEENTNVSIYAGLGTVNTDKGGSTKGMSTGEKIDYYQDRGVDRANQLATTGVFIDASSNKTDSVTIGQQSGISGGQGGVSGLVVGGNATLKGATEETQNVTVRGTTTVSNVETHHKESSVDFELRGTVASALGSDEGKAGQVSGKLFKASGSAKPANDSSTWQSAQPSNKSGARDADQGGVSIGSHRTSADTGGVSIGSHRASAAADPGGARPQQDGPTLTARKPDTDAPKRPRPDTDNVTGATKPASGYGAMPPVTAPERKPVTDTAARPDTTVVARQPAADAAPGARPDADASATPPAHYNSLVSGTTQVRKPGGTDTGAVPPRPDTSVATAPSAPVRQPGADMAPGTTRPDADASGAPPAHYNSLASGTAQLRKPGGTDPVATSLRPDTNVAFAPGASERKPVADATPNLRPDHDGLGQPPSSYNSPMSSAAQVRKPNAEGARPETGAAGRNDAAFTRVATNDAPQPPTRSGGEPDASQPRDAGAPADNVSRREPAARPLGDGTGERQVVASVAPDVTRRQAPTSDDGPRAPEARDAAGPEVPPANHGVSTGDRAAVLASLQPIGTAEDGSRTVYVNPANKLKLISIGSEFVGENTGNSEAHRKYAEWKDAGEIRYLSEPERRARELVVDPESGRLVNKVTGLPFDTGDKPDGAIFVIDASGRIYASAENEMGRFHHSSFTGGEPVALAGHIVVRDGKILHLNNQSGHYRPDGEQLRQGVDLLGRAGADLSSARVVERGPDYVRDLTTGTDLTGTARDIVELMRPDALRAVAQKLGIEELQYQGTVNGREIYFNPNNGLKLTGISHDYKGEEHGISKGHTTHPDWQGKGGVRYLNDADRAARELAVDPATGLLVNKQTGLPFDTGDKPDGAIFVIDAHGRIYASAENEQGRFHHSSFTGGEPVALAGHIVVRDGKLMHINNLSGHYWPDGDQLKQGYELLQKSGADLSEARVVGYGPGGLHDWTAGKPINDPSVRTFEDAIRPDVIRAMQRDGKLRVVGTADDGRTVYVNPANGLKLKGIGNDYKGEEHGISRGNSLHKDWQRDLAGNPKDGKVKYLTAEEREARELVIVDGRLFYKQTGEPFSTGTKHDGAIFVIDADGRIYASMENEPGRFHHSSFTGGEPVAMAGHMVVQDGWLLHVNNLSGHYRPDREQLDQAVDLLQRNGLNLNYTTIVEVGGEDAQGRIWRDIKTGNRIGLENPMTPDVERAWMMIERARSQAPAEEVRAPDDPLSWNGPAFQGDPANDGFWRLAA